MFIFKEIDTDNRDCVNYIERSKFDVWHWFDRKCPNNLHDDLMFSKEK